MKGDARSNYGQKDSSTPGQDTKKSAEANPQGMPPWLRPSRDVATSSNTTDTKKDQSGSSGSNWGKLLMTGFVATSLIARTGAQEVPNPSRTRDSNGNELVHRDVEHHSLEPRRVVGSSDSLPYENRGHPDLPSLQVDGVKVPRPTINDVHAVLQRKELLEKISRMTQGDPADKLLDKFLGRLAKDKNFITDLRSLCNKQDEEEVSKLVDKPKYQECIENLASNPGFRAMVKAMNEEAFSVLQEFDAKKKEEKKEENRKEIQKRLAQGKALAPVFITSVVALGIMYKFGGDKEEKRPIDGDSHSWGSPPGVKGHYADLRELWEEERKPGGRRRRRR